MNRFACGSFSSQMEEDDFGELLSPCSTPKRTSRKGKERDSNKNPYANRGLDKFSAVLAELEIRKQKIYTQKGSEEISFVRFVPSNSNDWKPIVVKLKDKKQDSDAHQENFKDKHINLVQNSVVPPPLEKQSNIIEEKKQIPVAKKWRKWRLNLGNIYCPYLYLLVMMILILVLLAIFGRSFAILCTSLGWYMVPTIINKDGTNCATSKIRPKMMNKNKKKEYIRRFSDKSIVRSDGSSSPESVLSGPSDKSPAKHGHKLSW
ncbi:hypothetical protein M9H77_32372 [Catharanthus roseus]|uniref:Uncharacterized protein n=1 Tax=Catharanthus roseus TaxID=4058 RepID=A0ACC0A467_CATRO|nr:hypothetical protein M9H77_32372 [Catharanthus roseus]